MGAQRPWPQSGFTLVEMAVVLVIIGLLVMTVFPALTISRLAAQRSVTQNNLQALMLATAAFVQANGCVPCPTPAATAGSGFGRVRGDTVAAFCNGCPTAEGLPPFVSLGVASNIAHDGWGHWIAMRVDPSLTAAALGTTVPPTSPCTAADVTAKICTVPGASQKGLCQPSLASSKTANPVLIATPGGAQQPAAVLFVSYGSKGYGAFQADAMPFAINYTNGCRLNFPTVAGACVQSLTCSAPSTGLAYAMCNASGANSFYNAVGQSGYDDMMAFADRNSLVSMLGNGAACQAGS